MDNKQANTTTRPPVSWIALDLSADKAHWPLPLRHQSGGHFWVVQDAGIHGVHITPAWWTGSRFVGLNSDNIVFFDKMDFPLMPETKSVSQVNE